MILSSAVPAFRDVIDVPLVVRRLHKSRSEVCMILIESVILQLYKQPTFLFSDLYAFHVSGEKGTRDCRGC
jgi:hypothetical protein